MPDAPAVLTAEVTLSHGQLDRAVSWTANSFKDAGLAPGDRVGVHSRTQVQHLITFLALARLGVGQIAFHPSDPPRYQRRLAERLGIRGMVSDGSGRMAEHYSLIQPPPAEIGDYQEFEPTESAPASDGELPFLFVVTSGTTGIPKLGVLSHAGFRPRLRPLAHEPVGPGIRALSLVDITFPTAKQMTLRCLGQGGCLALLDSREADGAAQFITERGINYLFSPPIHARAFLDLARGGEVLFPEVRAYRIGTTQVSETLRKEIQHYVTPNLFITYGSTEIGSIAVAPPTLVRDVPGVVGTIELGVKAEVRDVEGNPLAPGGIGRLCLKSPGMINGYLDAPEEAARAFQDGWFKSEDLAAFTASGVLVHHGRADDMMIFDGINIYPAEIENALLTHGAVKEAAAFPVRSGARGETPAAAVVVAEPVSAEELVAYCRSWLGTRAPKGLMILPQLPRNAAGKVLKKELADMFRRHLEKTDQSAGGDGSI